MTDPAFRSFGALVRDHRMLLDLSQAALGQRVGYSRDMIKAVETGRSRASEQLAELLAREFGVPEAEWAAFIQLARKGPLHSPGDDPLYSTTHAAALLTRPPTTFIGRSREAATVSTILRRADVRLLTLTGPGGVGKTRLALRVADQEQHDFTAGVVFVPLAPIRTPDLVLQTIAWALGTTEGIGRSLLDSIKAYLRDKHLLLVLDNFEHVLDAAPLVGELLAASSHLKVLTTSRAVLHISGEYEFAVPPLPLPNLRHLPAFAELCQYDALRLFQERVQATNPNFALTPDNAATVAAICLRLDGLPLAIELAATRSKIFAPAALLTRLDRRLALLVGGGRDLPLRQQTLHSTIAWSYDLLDPAEQRLFRRLAVFRGGFTIEAALEVCDLEDDLHLDVLEGLISLVDKSLLQVEPYSTGEPRFMMLETLQEYALEMLELHAETEMVCRQHACYYIRLVEVVAVDPIDDESSGLDDAALEQLFIENANLTAMATWIQEHDQDLTLRLSAALWDSGLTLVIGARALVTWADVGNLKE